MAWKLMILYMPFFFVFEHGGDDAGRQFVGLHGFEVFLRGEVDDGVGVLRAQGVGEQGCDAAAPVFVEVFAAPVGEGGCPFRGGRPG